MTTAEFQDEYDRQRAIFERQLWLYVDAKPRSRFAYAAHLTKTAHKLGRLESELHSRGVDVPFHAREAEIAEARYRIHTDKVENA